jgi:hypothetical protein
MVAAGIIVARITAAVLRDYDGMRLKKFKCTYFTNCEDIPQFTSKKMHALHCGIEIENGSKIPPNVLGDKSMHCIVVKLKSK